MGTNTQKLNELRVRDYIDMPEIDISKINRHLYTAEHCLRFSLRSAICTPPHYCTDNYCAGCARLRAYPQRKRIGVMECLRRGSGE